jgi:hypothetical protein
MYPGIYLWGTIVSRIIEIEIKLPIQYQSK